MTVRTGIIGFGGVARQIHAPILRNLDSADLVAICDTDEEAIANVDTVATYTDYGRMIEAESLDSIHVATPPGIRIPFIETAAQEGIAVLLEKPTCMTTSEFDRIAEFTDDIPICCTQNVRFFPEVETAISIVDEDRIGSISAIEMTWIEPKDLLGEDLGQEWVRQFTGGAIAEALPHALYLPLVFADGIGEDFHITRQRFEKHPSGPWFDGVSIHGRDQQHRLLSTKFLIRSPTSRTLTVYGTEGRLVVNLDRSEVRIVTENTDERITAFDEHANKLSVSHFVRQLKQRIPGVHTVPSQGDWGYGHRVLIRRYVDAVAQGNEVPVPPSEDRDVIRIWEQVNEAVQ